MRATTPSGSATASPRFRRTRSMLQIPHLPGQFETTPGSIGQKYSVSLETGLVAEFCSRATWVNRSQ